ncbi:MAG: amino acid-binding protein [Methanobrevibacter sp.]|uniref:amino acid-binding protein n=1 Tax=Methanobrevibacter sp. TaxID=66852 RepID=UPI0026E0B287|nr:amino acid-binding protein [Methanobrevibacter sp.]MDO5848867.1 amino acid-binding protein [Methanobrevibacter sp.]
MSTKQISVFLENKEGRIRDAIKILGEENINIHALSIADTTKYGILRLIVDDNFKAVQSFEKNNFIVRENDVVIVTVPDEPNGLNSTLEVLNDGKINIEYIYAFSNVKIDEAIVVIRLENIEKAIELFKENGIKVLEQEDIDKL